MSEFANAVKSKNVQPVDAPYLGAVYLPGSAESIQEDVPLIGKLYTWLNKFLLGNYPPVKRGFSKQLLFVILGTCVLADIALVVVLATNIWCLGDDPTTCIYTGLEVFLSVYPLGVIVAPSLSLAFILFSLHRLGRLCIKWNLLSMINAIVVLIYLYDCQSNGDCQNQASVLIFPVLLLITKMVLHPLLSYHLAVLECTRDGVGWAALKPIHDKSLSPISSRLRMQRDLFVKKRRGT
jgi:hypothetical protein